METLQTVNNNNYEFHRVYQKINGSKKNQEQHQHQQSSNSLIETQSDEQSDGAISLVAWLNKKRNSVHTFSILRLKFQTIPFLYNQNTMLTHSSQQ